MIEVKYMIGDATAPVGPGNKIICHVCNDIGVWGKGFVLALSKRCPQPEAAYRQWHKDRGSNNFGLGAVQWVEVTPEIRVANLIGQHGIKHGSTGNQDRQPPIRYEAIEAGLTLVAQTAMEKQASVHMPRIGCGLAGGTWDQIEPILRRTLLAKDVQVFVYDLP